ncbi:6-phosphogluconolactonase 1 [Wolffia australiana]
MPLILSDLSYPTASGGPDGRGEIKIYDNPEDLSTDLADYIAQLSELSVKERGVFSVALSGGSVIRLMSKLCEAPYSRTVDWTKWHVFWADERVVAKSHPASNYKLARDVILSKVPVLSSHVHSINDSLSTEEAAEGYEFILRQLVKSRTVDVLESSDCPKFDLILLGMGSDGHVASLFPGHPAVDQKVDWVTWITDSPKPPPERITFTLPVINSAANVAIVVAGVVKAVAVRRAVGGAAGGPEGLKLPVQMVSPTDGKLVWFLDRDAASKLDYEGGVLL